MTEEVIRPLFVGPPEHIDPVIYRVTQARAKASYDAPMFFPMLNRDEREMLGVMWGGYRQFFSVELPGMRLALEKKIENSLINHIHFDLGNCLATLYAAYYVSLMRREFSMTLHIPLLLGGDSQWSKGHPMTRRKIIMLSLVRAKNVYVTAQETAHKMMTLYPRVDREYVGYDFNLENPEESVALLPSL